MVANHGVAESDGTFPTFEVMKFPVVQLSACLKEHNKRGSCLQYSMWQEKGDGSTYCRTPRRSFVLIWQHQLLCLAESMPHLAFSQNFSR